MYLQEICNLQKSQNEVKLWTANFFQTCIMPFTDIQIEFEINRLIGF